MPTGEQQMRVPATEFLDKIERFYSVKYPRQYRELCAQLKNADLQNTGCRSVGADFISDIETFWSANIKVGEGQWGDWERAIVGKERPKDKNRLWGEILPFFFDEKCIFGFSTDANFGDQVYVWSIHTIVYVYPSLSAFAEAHFRVSAL